MGKDHRTRARGFAIARDRRLTKTPHGQFAMNKVVLLRHGESVWNRENRFTGWADVGLTEKGVNGARAAGELLKKEAFAFDLAFTSVLKRAIKTPWIVLEETDRMWIPVHDSWRLNERHYGALQGLNKAETAAKFGEAQSEDLASRLRHPAASVERCRSAARNR